MAVVVVVFGWVCSRENGGMFVDLKLCILAPRENTFKANQSCRFSIPEPHFPCSYGFGAPNFTR